MRQQQGARPTSGKRHWVSARGRGHDSRSKPRALLLPPEPALCARLGPHCSPASCSGPLPGPPRWPGLQTQGTRPPSVGTVSRPRTVPGDSCGSAPQAASWAHGFAVGSRGAVELAADCGSEGRTVAGRPRLSQSAARAPHSAGAGSGLGLTLSLRFRVQERGSPPLVFPQVCGEVQAGLGGSRLVLPPPAATACRHRRPPQGVTVGKCTARWRGAQLARPRPPSGWRGRRGDCGGMAARSRGDGQPLGWAAAVPTGGAQAGATGPSSTKQIARCAV